MRSSWASRTTVGGGGVSWEMMGGEGWRRTNAPDGGGLGVDLGGGHGGGG